MQPLPHPAESTTGPTVGPATEPPAEPADRRVRIGSLIWGVIALIVALWSVSTVLWDWNVDPVLMGIGLAGLVGIALIAGGIAGAAHRDH